MNKNKRDILNTISQSHIDEGERLLRNTKRNRIVGYSEDSIPLCYRGEINHLFISPLTEDEIGIAKSICLICNNWEECNKIGESEDSYNYYGIIGGIYYNYPLIDILLDSSLREEDDGRGDKNNLIRVRIPSQSQYGGERGYYIGYVREEERCIVCNKSYKRKRRENITCGRRCGGIYRHNKSEYDRKREDKMSGERIYNEGRRESTEDDGDYQSWGIVWDGGEEREVGKRGKMRKRGRGGSSQSEGGIDGEYWYNQ